MPRSSPALVVAGVSARLLAQAARQADFKVIGLDVFGDADTRAACEHWAGIGVPGRARVEAGALRAALAQATEHAGVIGWVAGSGFEAMPELLDAAPPALPLLGMPAHAVRAVRDPQQFFAALARFGLHHPATQFTRPEQAAGWLCKHSGGSGGWHIRRAHRPGPAQAGCYFQREQPGLPMSALFLADGRRARVVALNRLIVGVLGARPFVYRGAIGPIVDAALQAHIETALAALVPAFALRGLASLDFIADEGMAYELEINPRPSASMALHGDAWPGGLIAAHLAALRGELPGAPRHAPGLRGTKVLFARRALSVSEAAAAQLAALGHVHDRPMPGSRCARGDPVCSVSASGPSMAAVEQLLQQRLAQAEVLLTRTELT